MSSKRFKFAMPLVASAMSSIPTDQDLQKALAGFRLPDAIQRFEVDVEADWLGEQSLWIYLVPKKETMSQGDIHEMRQVRQDLRDLLGNCFPGYFSYISVGEKEPTPVN